MPKTDPRESLEKLIARGVAKGYIPEVGLSKDYPTLHLTTDHAANLKASGISSDVAEARVYVSITDGRFFVNDMFIPSWTHRAPCLMIPIWDVTGTAANCQIKPDVPREDKGRVIKYESLPDSQLRLDVPPAVKSRLGDPKIPLIITEGAKKADAAVSRGATCISLLGVWGFRGKNAKGGKAALADWESIVLNERTVYIAFDSDLVKKSQVATALSRLRIFLESRGARIRVVYFPEENEHEKVGLDDWLAVHELKELDDYVKDETEEKSSDYSYKIVDGRFVLCKGDNVEQLCNFNAKIELEEVKDDGLMMETFYHISGSTSGNVPLTTVQVPVSEFTWMNWCEENWRTRINMSAGRSIREHIAAAIKAHSLNAPVRLTYTHTGWRTIDKQRVFLYNGHYVPETMGLDIDVELTGPLVNVVLERENPKITMQELIQKFLDLGPHYLMIPLVSTVFTALLGEELTLDFAVHLEGITGSFKSELASLCQGFFGRAFNARHLPANWSSTANALEHQAFAAKDIVFVIDDYAPQPGKWGQDQLMQKAETVFRSAGNQAGRSRLTADIKYRPEYFPRGLIISTGEDALPGQSLNARVVTLNVNHGDIKTPILTELQVLRDNGIFSQLMRIYIDWLQKKDLSGLQEDFQKRRIEILSSHELHKRDASSVSKLMVGWSLLCDFIENGDEFRSQGEKAFRQLLAGQQSIQTEESLVNTCIAMLRSALMAGRVYLEISGDDGDNAKRARYGYRNIDGNQIIVGRRIGFISGEGWECIDPTAVHDVVWKSLNRSAQAIRTALFAEGYLKTQGKAQQFTYPIRHNGVTLRSYVFEKPIYEGLPAQDELNLDTQKMLEELQKRGY